MIMTIWCALIMIIVVDIKHHARAQVSNSIVVPMLTALYGEEDSRYGKLQYQTMIPSSTRAIHYSHVDNGYCWWGNVNNDTILAVGSCQ